MAENEIYWAESDVGRSAFSFDDTEDNVGSTMCGVSLEGTIRLFQEMRKDGIKDDGSFHFTDFKSNIPLSKLISEKSLNKILECDMESDPVITSQSSIPANEQVKILTRQLMDRWIAPDVNSTITRILLGRPFSLELYKSLEQKKSLLNGAIATGDGDAILLVVLFLMKTLKKGLFNQLLMSNPIAANHYIDYLSTRMQIQELTDIFTMLGRNKDASMKQFEMASRNPQRQFSRLNNCLQNHFGLTDCDRLHVEKFIKLLEWEQMAKVPSELGSDMSVVDCLSYACENHWSEPQGSPLSPFIVAQQHGVNDKQLQWTVLVTRGKLKAWEDVDNFFIAKRWLGGRKVKAAIPMEQVVMRLHSLNAPDNIIISYLSLIDNLEKRLNIARTVKCHQAVIDIFAVQRDRQSLISYKDCYLIPQSEEFIYAESKLCSPTIKWRN